ncbi:hypothetical protein ACWM9A_15120 [Acetobacter pasteurianus]
MAPLLPSMSAGVADQLPECLTAKVRQTASLANWTAAVELFHDADNFWTCNGFVPVI